MYLRHDKDPSDIQRHTSGACRVLISVVMREHKSLGWVCAWNRVQGGENKVGTPADVPARWLSRGRPERYLKGSTAVDVV
jgi:hypothetical protein